MDEFLDGYPMTLKPYSAEDFTELSLRIMDMAWVCREMSRRSEEEKVESLSLNDKKALEWCTKLEQWLVKAQADLEAKVRILRATPAPVGRRDLTLPAIWAFVPRL